MQLLVPARSARYDCTQSWTDVVYASRRQPICHIRRSVNPRYAFSNLHGMLLGAGIHVKDTSLFCSVFVEINGWTLLTAQVFITHCASSIGSMYAPSALPGLFALTSSDACTVVAGSSRKATRPIKIDL